MPRPPKYLSPAYSWFKSKGWKPFPFQRQAWEAYLNGESGLLNAPTGSGKTYALFMAVLMEYIQANPKKFREAKKNGLQVIWITPIRALANEIRQAAQRACDGLEIPWRVEIRSGDTSSSQRQRQSRNMPEVLITTPESLHLLIGQKEYPKRFKDLKSVIIDEWHELIGSKRGVQMELALSRLRGMLPDLKTWAISATIGNLEEAMYVAVGMNSGKEPSLIRSNIQKRIKVESIFPDSPELMPWAGHLGIKLLEKVVKIVRGSESTLIFTNTRAQSEIWYQRLLDVAPDLAGIVAMHHGSISRELRSWVEEALYDGRLKAVVCTSSLDLGVDFRPVQTIIQIGGPKGVAKFLQRAGRSGHQPGALSKIYFLPTHSLELLEAAALRTAIDQGRIESRRPHVLSFDVLAQYLVTLALSEGFKPHEIKKEIMATHAYHQISDEEWEWVLAFIHTGGQALGAYEEYKKVIIEDGTWKVKDRMTAMRHRLSIGTIVSDPSLEVKYVRGGSLGTIEEYFVARLRPGDVFWFSGRSLEFVRIKGNTVTVRKSKKKTGKIPAWGGGRMPFSSLLSDVIRDKLEEALEGGKSDPEIEFIRPILDFQHDRSAIPSRNECLMEVFETKDGHHLVMYTFEGRFVNEGIASLLAYRMSLLQPISFSIAMNDYGFELLSDQEIPVQAALDNDLLSVDHLSEDLIVSVNASQMAQRKFRDIASIAGLVFQGYPGKYVPGKHLQSTSALFFEVFREYDPDNLLLRQSFTETLADALEEDRIREALVRFSEQKLILSYPEKPTPFAFPIMVDRLRQKLTSEKIEDRVKKLQLQFEE